MRTPSELMELLVFHESTNDFESFAKSLSYEEVTMVMMTMELMLRFPNLTSCKSEMIKEALDYFKKIRNEFIERN